MLARANSSGLVPSPRAISHSLAILRRKSPSGLPEGLHQRGRRSFEALPYACLKEMKFNLNGQKVVKNLKTPCCIIKQQKL
jgi:hypothetical protein